MRPRRLDLSAARAWASRLGLEPGPDPAALSPSVAYDRMAPWYDWSGAIEFADSSIAAVHDVLADRGVVPSSVLDLACGTGTFLCAMARDGLDGVGVDRSLGMLAEAQRKVAAMDDADVTLVCGDLRSFALRRRFPLTTCFYDALNHLVSADDLVRAIARAAEHVAPGGLFVFDTSNEAMFEALWSDGLERLPVEGAEVTVRYRYDAATRVGTARLLLERDGQTARRAWVAERCHPRAEIEAALAAAGLTDVSREAHPHFDGEPRCLKDLWVGRRP